MYHPKAWYYGAKRYFSCQDSYAMLNVSQHYLGHSARNVPASNWPDHRASTTVAASCLSRWHRHRARLLAGHTSQSDELSLVIRNWSCLSTYALQAPVPLNLDIWIRLWRLLTSCIHNGGLAQSASLVVATAAMLVFLGWDLVRWCRHLRWFRECVRAAPACTCKRKMALGFHWCLLPKRSPAEAARWFALMSRLMALMVTVSTIALTDSCWPLPLALWIAVY